MRAVSNGDKADIDSLILKGADPNATPPMVISSVVYNSFSSRVCHYLQIQFTPLMEASRMGYVEITRLLLDNGADSNKINNVSSVVDIAIPVYSIMHCAKNRKAGPH